MKSSLFLLLIFCSITAFSQNSGNANKFRLLPPNDYLTLRDSCTQLDIVFTSGSSGSMSMEGRSVGLFSTFVLTKSIAEKSNRPKDGFIMWQKNGREFLSGDIYLQTDSNSYLLFKKDGNEYYHLLSPQGAGFLKNQQSK